MYVNNPAGLAFASLAGTPQALQCKQQQKTTGTAARTTTTKTCPHLPFSWICELAASVPLASDPSRSFLYLWVTIFRTALALVIRNREQWNQEQKGRDLCGGREGPPNWLPSHCEFPASTGCPTLVYWLFIGLAVTLDTQPFCRKHPEECMGGAQRDSAHNPAFISHEGTNPCSSQPPFPHNHIIKAMKSYTGKTCFIMRLYFLLITRMWNS